MKKTVAMLFAAILFAGFTACNKSDDNDENKAKTDKTEKTSKPRKHQNEKEKDKDEDKVVKLINKTIDDFCDALSADEVNDIANKFENRLSMIFEDEYGFDPTDFDLSNQQMDQLDEFIRKYADDMERLQKVYRTVMSNLGEEVYEPQMMPDSMMY